MFSFSILQVAPVADYKGWVKAWTGDGVGGGGEAVERKVLRGTVRPRMDPTRLWFLGQEVFQAHSW